MAEIPLKSRSLWLKLLKNVVARAEIKKVVARSEIPKEGGC